MRKNKLLSMIGMSRKAGKLFLGFDSVVEAMNKGKISLLLVCKDISAGTLKQATQNAEKNKVKLVVIELVMADIERIIGKKVGILGIADHNFAVGIEGIIMAEEKEEGGALYK